MSFVIFPIEEGPCLVGLVVGTQGLAPDDQILGRLGHARKAKAIFAWLNKTYSAGQQVAWAKQDPTRTDVTVPEELQKTWSPYRAVFQHLEHFADGIEVIEWSLECSNSGAILPTGPPK